jgi:hypothetical protein
VNLVPNESFCQPQEFCSNDDDRRGPVPNLLILQVRQLDKHSCRGVFHLEQFQDCRTVVGDRHVLVGGGKSAMCSV